MKFHKLYIAAIGAASMAMVPLPQKGSQNGSLPR